MLKVKQNKIMNSEAIYNVAYNALEIGVEIVVLSIILSSVSVLIVGLLVALSSLYFIKEASAVEIKEITTKKIKEMPNPPTWVVK